MVFLLSFIKECLYLKPRLFHITLHIISYNSIMFKRYYLLPVLALSVIIANCSSQKKEDSGDMYKAPEGIAQEVVDRAIELSGGDLFKEKKIKFSFRGIKFTVVQNDASYYYERILEQDGEEVKEILDNGLLTRHKNGEVIELTGGEAERIHEAVNSVPYFAMLPYKLNDGAVVKTYEGEVTIKGKQYHKIKITFEGEGSGTSPTNVFYYWFDKETGFLDYLGYSRGGNRFREAYNQRVVNGIRFADYVNYKSDALLEPSLEEYDALFEKGELRELSRIILDDVEVLDIDN